MLKLYITSTDNTKSKKFVTAGLSATMQSLGYSSAVYKPFETGVCEKNKKFISKDLSYIKFIDPYIKTYHSYQLQSELAPILSAASEGLVMEKSVILKDYQKIQDKDECLIVDGLYGLGTPISIDFLEEDVVKMLDLPLLFVASADNSDINNVLLSVNRSKNLNLELRGVIITDFPDNTSNPNIKLMPKLIEEYTDTKILGILPHFEKNTNPEDLITEIINKVDIESVFKIKIAKLDKCNIL